MADSFTLWPSCRAFEDAGSKPQMRTLVQFRSFDPIARCHWWNERGWKCDTAQR